MLKIAICDDDLGFTGSLENLVLEESRSMGLRVDTDVFSMGIYFEEYTVRRALRTYFIDIEMEQVDGISAARKSVKQTVRCCSYIYQDMINI